MTWEAILAIAERIEDTHPEDATKLRFCASLTRWLEEFVNERVQDEWAASQAKPRAPRKPRRPRLVPSPEAA